jgi:hypothetical protein
MSMATSLPFSQPKPDTPNRNSRFGPSKPLGDLGDVNTRTVQAFQLSFIGSAPRPRRAFRKAEFGQAQSDRGGRAGRDCGTIPELSLKYTETVCTGGVLENGRPIRLYPIPYRYLEGAQRCQHRVARCLDFA